jgi:NAD(P)-dependent dehydrogenase (short-subunit alcohol dehydrogenase family)/acyl carrier protein
VAQLHVRGVEVDWSAVLPQGSPVPLPTYPFQHQRYWLERVPSDKAFWEIVRRQDLVGLAESLNVTADAKLSDVLPALVNWRAGAPVGGGAGTWRHRVEWTPVADRANAPLDGTWLVVSSGDPFADLVCAALAAQGADPVLVGPADVPAVAVAGQTGGILLLPTAIHGDAASAGVTSAVSLLQDLGRAGVEAPVWITTRDAVAVDDGDAVTGFEQATLWGLGPVVRQEKPELWGGLVDLPLSCTEDTASALVKALAEGEDQFAVRSSGLLARRLVRAPAQGDPWRPAGTALITGGTGALGAHTARWLAREGAEHLVLASRRGQDAPGAADLKRELEDLGVRVTLAACDVSDRAALAHLVAEYPPTVVVHAAAVLDDATLDALTPERIEEVLNTKARTALHLHELTRDLELSAFVLFSSMAGTLGSAGQGNYAPGNAFLDALAWHRRAQGLPATSIAWGPWAAGGGFAERTEIMDMAHRHGVSPMRPDAAVQALGSVGDPYVLVADVDWDQFPRGSFLVGGLRQPEREQQPALADRLAELTEAEQARLVLTTVQAALAAVLGHPTAEAIGVDRAVSELGMDSMTAMDLRNRLSAETGLPLPATLVYNHPTIAALAEYLLTRLRKRLPAAESSVDAELSRLEAAVTRLPTDKAERGRVAGRLRALLSEVEPAKRADFTDVAQDELLALIDEEFGK